MYVGPLLDGGLEAGHEVLWGPPRPSLHARDHDDDGYIEDRMLKCHTDHSFPNSVQCKKIFFYN